MLAKSHSEKSKSVRKAKKTPTSKGVPTLTEMYNTADDTVSAVYVDIANGVSRSDCLQKLQAGLYGNRPVKARQSAYIYNAALDRFAVDCDIEADKLRNMFWGRYEALYEDCVKAGDRYNARGTLDSMAKIFLGLGREKAMIEINKDANNIKITFGFSDEENNVEDQEVEIIDG